MGRPDNAGEVGDPKTTELTARQIELRGRARTVAEGELRPHAAEWDEREEFPERSYAQLRAHGLVGLTVPVEYGGQGLGVFEACLVLEEVARGCLASAMTVQMNLNGPPRVIARLGDEGQRRRYLPGAADGSRYFAVAMTEPQAGSDGTALATELRPDGTGYRLRGTKCHITGAARADTFLVFCRAPDTSGPDGIGAVLVERDSEGFDPVEIEPKMGGRGVSEGLLRFHDVPVAADQVLLAPEPGSRVGARLLVRQFNPERCGNAAMCVGVAQAALNDASAYLMDRQQFGRRLVEFQGLQWKIADMAVDVEAARLLVWRAARSDVDGFPALRETAMAKLFANEMAVRVCNEGIQLLGHKGYLRRFPMERYFRDVRGLAIGGGTTEVLRNMIASEVTGVRLSQRGG